MGKLNNYRVFVVIGVIALCIILAFVIRSLFTTREIAASVSPLDIEIGQPIIYNDSTKGANAWLWEFGNGDESTSQQGKYTFAETGRYQIRLKVDNKQEKKFVINVRAKQNDEEEQLVHIEAPKTAMQGEYIIFRGEGPSKEWRWEFGETGIVDSREKSAIYKYELPGNYEVLLSTEETQYPVRHQIEILPQYTEDESTDVESLIGNDIKEKLQNIIDQKPFNKNYNYVLSTYLCNNPNTLVVVNNNKKNDFYSYCQGLKIIGRKKTTIDNVIIELDPLNDACIQKLIVVQYDN
ncbi:PKD domain-containing protein [Dysgonomonas sp. 25]|uniref:PKD domain-containing protein n=1 Tax=Dysgonomonas sp. 25 TaxID=2302933 RepID=UPI0013D22A8B|nr:PKD domain-containing protein [Dysgonomonas sp. 25]NDV70014.1 PKD domain-containing protein [Dysgonomonas sp. 25]